MRSFIRSTELVEDSSTGGLVVVLGDKEVNGTVWCADWRSLRSYDAQVRNLRRSTAESPTWWKLLARLEQMAVKGDPDAMWWCASAYGGTNRATSTWYFVAAMRRDPEKYGWAFERVLIDASASSRSAGMPPPDLSFMQEIAEFRGGKQGWGDWREAIQKAIEAKPMDRDEHGELGPVDKP